MWDTVCNLQTGVNASQKICRFLLNSEGCSTHKNNEVKYKMQALKSRFVCFLCYNLVF